MILYEDAVADLRAAGEAVDAAQAAAIATGLRVLAGQATEAALDRAQDAQAAAVAWQDRAAEVLAGLPAGALDDAQARVAAGVERLLGGATLRGT